MIYAKISIGEQLETVKVLKLLDTGRDPMRLNRYSLNPQFASAHSACYNNGRFAINVKPETLVLSKAKDRKSEIHLGMHGFDGEGCFRVASRGA